MNTILHRLCVITTILSTCYMSAGAQLLQAKRSHYSTDNGLCSNAISEIVQDDMGYIWIATWNGLSRFDGYHFFNYQTGAGSHIPNLHNRILHLTIDNQQNVWLQMYDGRVFVLKRNVDRIINPFENLSGNEEFKTNTRIMVADNGDVLANIENNGIYRIRQEQDEFNIQLITTNGLTISSMAEGYQGDIWLGTDQGIHRLDPSNMTVERRGQFTDEQITCLYSNGYNIYGGTRSGKIVTFAYGTEPSVIRNGDQAITAVFADSHNLVWFTDQRLGACKLDPATGQEHLYTQNVSVPDYDGYGGVFHESGGILWMRMNHGGYGYYNRQTDQVEYFHNDPINPWNLSNTVNAAAELPEGVVFQSTSRRGLEKLEIMKKTITRNMMVTNAQSNLENETRAIYYDKERHLLLIGNKANSLFFYNEEGNIVGTVSHDNDGNPIGRVYGLAKDSKGNYWLTSKDNGLFRITPTGSGTFSVVNMRHDDDDPNTISSNGAYASVEDKRGNIWVATYGGGVNVLTRNKEGKQVFLHSKNGMTGYPYRSHMKIRALALDGEGNVWAGSTDGILVMSCQDGEVKIQRVLASEEYPDSILLSNDIVCLGTDAKKRMWVGTNGGGLACVTGRDSHGAYLFRHYGAHDGLPGEEIRSLTFDSKDNVWFATDNTLCSFDLTKNIFSTYSDLDGVNETMCSEGAAVTLDNDNIIFGTVEGYYLVDRKKLVNPNSSMLKLHITDFWLNDELQSPRYNNVFPFYVPESRSITLTSHSAKVALRFASLNYQLQHRVHYQYMLEGYDTNWRNADKTRTASYPGLPTGTYTFKVKAFLLESPENADIKQLTIIVPPHWFLSSNAVWLYMLLAALLAIRLMFWRQRKIRLRIMPESEADNAKQAPFFKWRKKKQAQEHKNDDTDEYELLD